jgi:transcriptional regulator with XRE-family HTH domain
MEENNLVANILSVNDFILEDSNPGAILRKIAESAKKNRLELNLSQSALATKSGVSLGSLKRFEHSSEISLRNLVMLSVAMDASEEFGLLFSRKKYKSIDELLTRDKSNTAKRGRRNV